MSQSNPNRLMFDAKGSPVGASNPNRLMWHSAMCGYWTDDWSKLKRFGPGIPCCPVCHCPGMQTTMKDWDKGSVEHDKKHPGYLAFLNENKEVCFGRGGLTEALKAAGFFEEKI